MARPTKGGIRANANYLKEWDDFQKTNRSKHPILLPISVSIEDGIIARDRIKSGDIAAMKESLMADFRDHCQNPNGYMENCYNPDHFEKMIDDYVNGFPGDNKHAPHPANPLDLNMYRPVWLLFQLPRKNWKFSKDRQFSTENDRDDFARNFEKITTLQDRDILLLANHCRSSPKNLKYNLHVTISQKQGKKTLYTDIIIDPGTNNGTREEDDVQSLP